MSGSLFICYDRKVTYCSTESILEVSPRDNKKYITSLWILEKPYVHEGTVQLLHICVQCNCVLNLKKFENNADSYFLNNATNI